MYPDASRRASGLPHSTMASRDADNPGRATDRGAPGNVEIRDTAQQQLVTAIEILSPVNKREPGLRSTGRNASDSARPALIEIDLIRRGTRPLAHPRIPT